MSNALIAGGITFIFSGIMTLFFTLSAGKKYEEAGGYFWTGFGKGVGHAAITYIVVGCLLTFLTGGDNASLSREASIVALAIMGGAAAPILWALVVWLSPHNQSSNRRSSSSFAGRLISSVFITIVTTLVGFGLASVLGIEKSFSMSLITISISLVIGGIAGFSGGE